MVLIITPTAGALPAVLIRRLAKNCRPIFFTSVYELALIFVPKALSVFVIVEVELVVDNIEGKRT